MKKIFAFSMILILCLGLLTACSSESTTTTEAPAGTEADKTEAAKTEAATTEAATEAPTEADDGKLTAHLTIIDKEGQKFEYDIKFSEETTMREALFEAGLISEEQHGAMFIEDIDGHVADVMNDGCTWIIQDKDANDISANMDEVIVKDGDEYILQYYEVPNFDD